MQKRSEASKAVKLLRELLHLTQQRFAVEVLRCAITTVARWETKDPPHGETLLRLADIARRHGACIPAGKPLRELSSVFIGLYMEEVMAKLRAVGSPLRYSVVKE